MKFKKLTALFLALLMMSSAALVSCDGKTTDGTDGSDDTSNDSNEKEEYNPYPYKDLSEFMDLPKLENLAVTEQEITDSLMATLSNLSEKNNLYTRVESGKAEKWHKSVIDFVGTVNGEVFEGGTGKNYSLVLGSGSFVPGFEEGVIGMEIGEVKPITFNFPENYYEDLAGKEVTFTVTLNELYALPEITDEFCAEHTYFKTAKEFLSDNRKSYIQNTAYSTLLNRCELKKKPNEYTEYYQSFITYFSSFAQNQGYSLEQFLALYGDQLSQYGLFSGMTVNQFYTVAENYATSCTVDDLLLYSLVRFFDLKTEGAEYDKALAELLTDGTSYDDLVSKKGETAVITSVMNIQVLNRLTDYVTVKQ